MTQDRYQKEAAFFDEVSSKTVVKVADPMILDRYKNPKQPQLFPKEFMFSLLSNNVPLKILEIGCGEGAASTQLAYCGHDVTGMDISAGSIEVAKRRAEINDLKVNFLLANLVTDDELGEGIYDVVWCDLILHHLVGDLELVIERLYRALKPGGMFITREPVAYAGWLKRLRYKVPVETEATDDECPLRESELIILRARFPDLKSRYYRIFARVDRITGNLTVIGWAARLDNLLLRFHSLVSLAGTVVMWGRKT